MKIISLLLFQITINIVMSNNLPKLDTICGNKHITSLNFNIDSIPNIEICNIQNVILIYSDKNEIVLETDENILPYIQNKIYNRNIIINKMPNYIIRPSTETVYIYSKNIKNINATNCINLTTVGKYICDIFKVKIQSISKIVMDINAQEFDCIATSISSCNFSGSIENGELFLESVSYFNSKNFISQNINLIALSCGNIEVFCKNEININANSVANLTYFGSPFIKEINLKAVAKIKKG